MPGSKHAHVRPLLIRIVLFTAVQYATDVKNLIIKNSRHFGEKKMNVTSFVLKIVWNTPSLP